MSPVSLVELNWTETRTEYPLQLCAVLSKALENGIPCQIERDSHFVWRVAGPIYAVKQ